MFEAYVNNPSNPSNFPAGSPCNIQNVRDQSESVFEQCDDEHGSGSGNGDCPFDESLNGGGSGDNDDCPFMGGPGVGSGAVNPCNFPGCQGQDPGPDGMYDKIFN